VSDVASQVTAAREAAALFALSGEAFERGVLEVTGGDARRWLDGMLTNDVTRLSAADASGDGCYAALLTQKGRIIADLHVLARPGGAYWLETAVSAVPRVQAALGRFIVADDVTLTDRSADWRRLAVEGPGASDALAAAAGFAPAALAGVPAEHWTALALAGAEVVAARFGWTGRDAWQLFVPASGASAAGVREALQLPAASVEALEVLRIEAGVPRLGPELDEEVFPDEARLDAAISRTKGCYTGQEIVARLYSRGAVNHLLVRLQFEGDRVPAPGSPLHFVETDGDKRSGEVTSACDSPGRGVVGLGFVRREHAEPGTRLRCEDPDGSFGARVV